MRQGAGETRSGTVGDTAYWEHGSGYPVLLIHGVGMDHAMWDEQAVALSRHFRVITYDLLGHGRSAKPAGPYTLSMYASQGRALLDGLGIARAAIVGFSLGGLIAQAFCIENRSRVAAAAFLGCAYQRTTSERELILQRVRLVEASGPAATVPLALERWFSRRYAERRPDVLERVAERLRSNDRDAYLAAYRLVASSDAEMVDLVETITCPVLVMTGSEDRGNSPGMAMRMAEQIPDSRLVILPGLKHMAMVEDPAAVNEPLIEFLLDVKEIVPARQALASGSST